MPGGWGWAFLDLTDTLFSWYLQEYDFLFTDFRTEALGKVFAGGVLLESKRPMYVKHDSRLEQSNSKLFYQNKCNEMVKFSVSFFSIPFSHKTG